MDSSSKWAGAWTALVTPFQDGAIDVERLDALVERQVSAGVAGVVVCGSTGESATLSGEEHAGLVARVVSQVAGRCKVLAGTGTNATGETIRRTQHAERVGADGALVVTPYYNRPTQAGLFAHFHAVAESVQMPIVLYNVPSRCAVDLSAETAVRLGRAAGNVEAVKDSSGGVDRVSAMVEGGLAVLCGDDSLTWPMMALGAVGVVSVIGNLVPEWMVSLVEASSSGDASAARRGHVRVAGLADALGAFGPNPVPIKTAMAVQGLLAEAFRLPLCPMEADRRRALCDVLSRFEVPATS